MSEHDALKRIMELAGLSDSVRSNEKLDEIFGFGNKGPFKVKYLDKSKYNVRGTVTSNATGGVYEFSFEPYGASASRGASNKVTFVRVDVKTAPSDPSKEDTRGLASEITSLLNKFIGSAQVKKLELQGQPDPVLTPTYQALDRAVAQFNAQHAQQ